MGARSRGPGDTGARAYLWPGLGSFPEGLGVVIACAAATAAAARAGVTTGRSLTLHAAGALATASGAGRERFGHCARVKCVLGTRARIARCYRGAALRRRATSCCASGRAGVAASTATAAAGSVSPPALARVLRARSVAAGSLRACVTPHNRLMMPSAGPPPLGVRQGQV